MIKGFVEILLVIAVSLLPINLAVPAPKSEVPYVSTTAYSAEAQKPDPVRNARFENMLNKNYCFNDDFSSVEAILLSSKMSLASASHGGAADKITVDAFAYGMYGADTSACPAENGKYPALDCGYDIYRHTVKSVEYNGDGTLTVKSLMVVNPDGETEEYEAVSVFRVNGESPFGYNILSCSVNW